MIYCENVVKYCGRSIFFFNSSSNFNNYYFFSSYFRQWHCHNCHQFFFPISAMALPQLVFSQQVWAASFSVMWLPKFKIFSLPLFLFLSHTFVDFQSASLGNKNFGNVIIEIQNFLSPTFTLSFSYFCWISATLLPKFTLFPQFPK